jgi:tRNA nucleotidyltransferase (CCA-adding enzyme)
MNLAQALEKACPPALWGLVRGAGEVAWSKGLRLYLVGGAVRDLLLGRPSLDLDLVVEGDALALLPDLGWQGRLRRFPAFGTAKLLGEGWSLDLASARKESYPRPGALPRVGPGTLQDDLFRRDFALNALAVDLSPPGLGEVLDPFGGRQDTERGLIRVLHERSFQDDATRILRAIKYAARFGFRLEARTRRFILRDKGYLEAISGDRLRRELVLILEEDAPEKALALARRLSILGGISPGLKGDGWLVRRFSLARRQGWASPEVYLALLAWRMTRGEATAFRSRFHFPRTQARAMEDIQALKGKEKALARPRLARHQVYGLLAGCSGPAVLALALASAETRIRRRARLFWEELRYVKCSLRGEDLLGIGVKTGPEVGKYLRRLLEARLDGVVRDRAGEEKLVLRWLRSGSAR